MRIGARQGGWTHKILALMRRLQGKSLADSESQQAFQQLNQVAPLKFSPQPEDQVVRNDRKYSFICREAVLSRQERIEGYDFSLERGLQSRKLENSAQTRRLFDDALLRNLSPLEVPALLGHRILFIHLSPLSLQNPLLDAFARLNVVIMVTLGEMANIDLPGMHASLRRLKDMGIRHGWRLGKVRPGIGELLTEADFIELDSGHFDGIELKTLYRQFRTLPNRPRLIVSELQTIDDFSLSYHCGYDYFMGPFVSDRRNWQPSKSDINRLKVFEVLNLVRSGAASHAIADCLRTEPMLTYKLLRYINSPGIGLLHKADDISQALLVLGSDRFYRWLSLLLFDFTKPNYQERVMNEQALVRARFMELLAGKGEIPDNAEQLFLTGLFSMLDVMMAQPLGEILKQIALPDAVVMALRNEPGPMSGALSLASAMESRAPDEMAAAALKCGLDTQTVTAAMMGALSWAHQVSSAGE